MDIKKLVPWDWFKKEDDHGKTIPVKHEDAGKPSSAIYGSVQQLHHEIDRLFSDVFRGFGRSPFAFDRRLFSPKEDGMLKPTLDLSADDREYTVTVEIPGVDEKDVKLEIANNVLTIKGEKKQEKEEKEKNFYRVERSYGAFQRILSLPEDADQDDVRATFKKGVLTVTMSRKQMPKSSIKQIEVKSV